MLRTSSITAWASALAFFLAAAGGPIEAQIPTAAEAQRLLLENPDLARQQLLQSGLSESEARARLAAAGVPADALDAFFSDQPIDAGTTLDVNAIEGLRALGLVVETADGLEIVEVATGMQAADPEGEAEQGLPVFGHGVFRRATSQFQPLLSGPVPDDYRVGPGDQLLLLLTGEVELAHDLVIAREGFVVVPAVGRLSVSNLTLTEVRTLLRSRLADFYSGINRGTTTVNVTITELRTIQVNVIGEVVQPGAYQLASVATVTNALYAAGGPKELGSLRNVRVQRRDGEDTTLDLYPYLLSGDASDDVGLGQGDVIFVPLKERRVSLYGSVIRPAQYELSASDDLLDVLRAAGGFEADANRRRLTIHRVVRPSDRGPGLGDRVAIDLGLEASANEDAPNHLGGALIPPIGLQDGDSIVVDEVAALEDGYHVTIAGMVSRPDMFPWREGMTLRELVELARGPVVGADLREAEVSRLPDGRDLGELADRLRIPLDSSYLSYRAEDGRFAGPPGVSFAPPGTASEFVLQPYDHVLILQQPDFEMPGSVKITGEVSVPGEYTMLSKVDRVTDLIARGGMVLEQGYLEGARLYRSMDNMGRIDLDLPAALADPEGPENITLQPGDSLDIPVYSPTVVVRGAVNSPVTVLYRQDQSYDYYIAAAGGYRSDADKGRTSVRYANGLAETRSKFLLWSRYPEPGPGSTISVPAQDPADRLDTRGLIADIVAIAGSITTVIVVIVSQSR